MTDPSNEVIWLTYEAIVSEVEYEYAGKFDATEKDKQWAVARRMFMAGKGSRECPSQGAITPKDLKVVLSRRTSEPNNERNRLKRELLEELMELALGSEADNYRAYDGHVAEWLRDQLKGVDNG